MGAAVEPSRPEEPPPGLVEGRIRAAMAAGEFEHLPGAGKPIPDLGVEDDPGWWVKRWIERERLRDLRWEAGARRREAVIRARAERDAAAARRRLEAVEADVAALNARLPDRDRLPSLDIDGIRGESRRRGEG
jgi:hypothetical protein